MPANTRMMRTRTGRTAIADPEGPSRPGRLIPIIVALYLSPALLVVLVVGGIGLLVLGIARAIAFVLHGPEASEGGVRV
jgi:hypothetical protein